MLFRSLRKIKPDQINYDADLKPIGEGTYSKAKAEELKKAREAVTKMEAAIDAALADKPDFSKLFNLAGDATETPAAE